MRTSSLILVLLFSLIDLSAQDEYYQLQLEPSLSMARSPESVLGISMPAGLEIRYRRDFISIGLKYESAVGQFGEDSGGDGIFSRDRTSVPTSFDLTTPNLHRLARLNTFEFIGDIHIQVLHTRLRFGMGVSLNKFASYYQDSNNPATALFVNPPRYLSQVYRIGYQTGPLHFYYKRSFQKGKDIHPIMNVGLGYTIGFLKKKAKFNAWLWPKEQESRHLRFRWDIGYGTMIGLTRQNSAGAISISSDVLVGLSDFWYFGGYFSFLTQENGTNPGTADLIPSFPGFQFPNNANQLGATEIIVAHLDRRFAVATHFDAVLGVGYGLYQFNGLPDWAGGPEKQSPGGLFLKASVVAGAFSNGLHLHLPGGELKPFLEFRLGVGLSLFKNPDKD